MIKAWSFSRLLDFEKCPHMVKLKAIDKIPEPKNQYSERGTQLHSAAEAFVKGETPTLHEELRTFDLEMNSLRELYPTGKVHVEQEWAHDREWNICGWRDESAWVRIKLDFFVLLTPSVGLVVDLKSGRKFGNEIKHAEQGQLYAGAAFLRFPELKKVQTEFWYSDKDDLTKTDYTPKQAAKFIASFDRRGQAMTAATVFPAKPSIFACRYCAYRAEEIGGTGDCKFSPKVLVTPAKKQWR